MYNDNLKDQVKRISPAEMESRGVINPARKAGTYICPICKNGTGSTGDGLVVYDNPDGYSYTCFTHKCGLGGKQCFDNIDLLAIHYGLDVVADFPEILKRAAADFGIADGVFVPVKSEKPVAQDSPKETSADESSAEVEKKYLEIINHDINSADDGLNLIAESDRRGLSIETLRYFGCIYAPQWLHPKARAVEIVKHFKFDNPALTPRLIIPTENHYVAVAVDSARGSIPKNEWKKHAGKIATFGLNTIAAVTEIVFVFEGEIDAMSARQAYHTLTGDNCAAFIGAGGASRKAVVADIDKICRELNICPLIAVVFDNDATGKEQSARRVDELHALNLPAQSFFLSADKEKIDANDFIRNEGGDAKLFSLLQEFWSSLEKTYAGRLEELLSRRQASAETADSEKAAVDARARKDLLQKIFYLPQGDTDNAERILALHGAEIRFDTTNKEWYDWSGKGGVWKNLGSDDRALYPRALQVAKFIDDNRPKFHYVKNSSGGVSLDETKPQPENAEQAKIAEKLSRSWHKKKTIANAVEMLKGYSDILITQADLDNYPYLLNVKNGVVDLTTGKLLKAAPELLLTRQANFSYDLHAQCRAFDEFMTQIFPDAETRAAILRFGGYCLTGSVKEQKFLFAQGGGGNGKGTFFGTLLKLLGTYGTSFNVNILLKNKGGVVNPQSATPALALFDGVRFAYAPETPEGGVWNIAELKEKTGGDRFSARGLYQKPKDIDPQFKLVISGQYIPRITNSYDVGVDRRMLLVEFTQSFTDDAVDFDLPARLQAAASLNGIGMLLIREAAAYYNGGGLIVSSAMKASKETYKADNDFIARFIEEYCEEGGRVVQKEFLARLKAETRDAYKFNDRELTAMVKRTPQCQGSIKSNGKTYFTGFHFADSAEQTSF